MNINFKNPATDSKIGRNSLCYCGSGKKYKKCCLNKPPKNMRPADVTFTQNKIIKRSEDFILGMARACQLSRLTLDYLAKHLLIGISTKELDSLAYDFMFKHGAKPATLNYNGFPASICTSINEVICHGIPNSKQCLKSGDIINLDVSCKLDGFFGDLSKTFVIGNASPAAKKLVSVTEECLNLGIKAVKPYGNIGDIGHAILNHATKNGFSVVEAFVGHGIGQNFHEDPVVPHFGKKGQGLMILPGMIFTIEPMINQGVKEAVVLADGWTAVTADRKLSAQFEHTILVTQDSFRVLTNEYDIF